MTREELIDKVAYRQYEIRTKGGEDNPLYGYGDADTDHYIAERAIHFFENIEDYLLSDKYVKEYYQDYVDLYGDLLIDRFPFIKEGKNE